MRQFDTARDAARWLRDRVRGDLHCDSRRVKPGDGFIAWPGAAVDGRQFVPAALRQGAAACLVEREGLEAYAFDDLAVASYAALKAATGPVASLFYREPSAELAVLAVTGTNGKTSTAWWLAQALSALEAEIAVPCGLVGTLGIGRPPELEFTGLTTPDPVLLQRQFRRFVDQGLRACAIEASSIGMAERRLDGSRIKVAIFTNFTHDHLDYHGSMEAYWAAKAELFAWPGLEAAVINLDDPKGAEIAAALTARPVDTWTYAIEGAARLQARDIRHGGAGLHFTVVEAQASYPVRTELVGQYNVSNLLGVIGAMRAMGVGLDRAAQACSSLQAVPGRMERLALPGRPLVAVDYAHTPDALRQALLALQPLARERDGQLWCVFGCGGDRDARKRPLMGAQAQRHADRIVLTSDNPRSEDPLEILRQILGGMAPGEKVHVQAERAHAIDWALEHASPQDVILIAGKGHEHYQEIAGVRLPFSDRERALQAMKERDASDTLASRRLHV